PLRHRPVRPRAAAAADRRHRKLARRRLHVLPDQGPHPGHRCPRSVRRGPALRDPAGGVSTDGSILSEAKGGDDEGYCSDTTTPSPSKRILNPASSAVSIITVSTDLSSMTVGMRLPVQATSAFDE